MRKKLMNNLGLKILAFLAAVTLWFLVVNIDNPVTDRTFSNIPVTVINDDIVTDSNRTYQIIDGTSQVSVTVTATRRELSRISTDDIKAVADMRELTLGTQVPIQVTVEGHTYEEAYSTPRNLQVRIEEEARNNFPITPTTIGTVREGYVIGNLKADPTGITIRGPKSVLNSINRVCAEVDVSGLSESEELEANLVLYDVNNNVIDQTLLVNNLGEEGLSVEVELYQTKDVPIRIDDSGISAAEGYSISNISCEPQDVLLSGDEDTIRDLVAVEIPESELELSGLTQRTEHTVDITEYLPEGVTLVDPNASNVVVTITVNQPGAQVFEVATNAIVVSNLAEDLEVSYGTAVDLEFQIRGPQETLSGLSLAKKVSIDLKECTSPGTYTVPVKVDLPKSCSLVNDVQVEIVLKKISGDQEE
ncbi:CdaR family protein [uncultured Merdimonas sp.]|uniref:CdaR family protein n=1 Tax=uncultured Merdimonas sp. TaxID=2023269 RepID=UPI003208766C